MTATGTGIACLLISAPVTLSCNVACSTSSVSAILHARHSNTWDVQY